MEKIEDVGSLDTLVQTKLEADTSFQESIADLPDDELAQAVASKRNEILLNEIKKRDELANNYKVRAEKAERDRKGQPGEVVAPKPATNETVLSFKDSYAMQTAGVPVEDVDEVLNASKLLGKSIQETLADPIVIARLAQLKSFRTSEQAVNGKPARGVVKEVSESTLLENAAKGIIPEKGSKDAERLFFARRKQAN